jgi:Streptogramin lyase
LSLRKNFSTHVPVLNKAVRYYLVLLAVASGLTFGCGESAPPYQFSGVSTYYRLDSKLSEPFGIAVHDGRVYMTDGNAGEILSFKPGNAEISRLSALNTPSGIAVDKQGTVFFAETGANVIKRIGPKGEPSAVAGIPQKRGFADGDATAALFNGPTGISVADDGRLFVADTYNDRIRVIENGKVRTLAGGSRGFADGNGPAAMFDTPLGISLWQGDKLLVADAGNRRIRVVEPDGTVWTLAGDGNSDGPRDGIPASASLVRPTAVTVDERGVIFIADGNAIRAIGLRALPFLETIAGGRRSSVDGPPRTVGFNRPSGIAFFGDVLLIADSDNGVIRSLHEAKTGAGTSGIETHKAAAVTAAEFRNSAEGRWPYDPPLAKRDIAGTLGEIRGGLKDDSSQVWFHNGLDVAGNYGETTRFVRDETVLDPLSADNFNTLRELLRMPTLGYIHIRLGRDANNVTFGDERFVFNYDATGNAMSGVRVPRGARFKAGEPIGTLNPMNHVHLIAGRSGSELNALAALNLPGVSDSVAPVIENVTLFDEAWNQIETNAGNARIRLTGKTRVVVRAFDRMDGNPERRRLGVYRLGYEILKSPGDAKTPDNWSIAFDKNPPSDAVRTVYAKNSHSGATGETIFNYIVTNTLSGDRFAEGFIDAAAIGVGQHTIRVYAADFFGNTAVRDILVEVN